VEQWGKIGSLPNPRSSFGALTNGPFVYILGGTDNYAFLNTVIMSQVTPDGSLKPWNPQPSLNIKRAFSGTLIHNNHMYVVGGGKGPENEDLLDSIERAKINEDGTLGKWALEKNRLNFPSRCKKLSQHNGYIYSVGGWTGTTVDTVERAKINEDGSLGEWIIESEIMNSGRYIHSIFENKNYLYALAGHDVASGKGLSSMEYAMFNQDGSMSKWLLASPLPYGVFGQSVKKVGDHIYLFGGRVGEKNELTKSVIRGTLDKNQPGNIGWSKMASTKNVLEHLGALHIGDRMYLLGGRNPRGARKDIYSAEISSNGSLGIWISPKRYQAQQANSAGLKKSRSNNIKEAQKYFSKAVGLDNTYWDGYLNLGSSYILMGNYDKAISILEDVLQRNPTFEDGYLLMAVAYDNKKDIGKALKYIELAIDNGVGDVMLFFNHPGFRNSKKDPRFEPLMKKKLKGRFIH